jgi:type I restriction enzyme, S subunit
VSERNDELPLGWAGARLDDLGEWHGGGTPSKSKSAFWTNGNVPWVSPKDMKTFYIDDTEDHITDEAVEKSAAKLLQPSSVLVVTRSGILQRTLPVAINRVSVTTNQDLKSLVPNNGVEPMFVAHFLKAYDSTILDECSKDGTTVASIDLPKLKAFRFMLPPVAEQQRIVAKIEALQERSQRAREVLAEVGSLLEQFRQSVLAAAFRGDLTADWRATHTNVEPASELLHRIRVERRRRWEEAELAKYEAKGQKPPQNWKDKYKEPEPVDDAGPLELPEGWAWSTFDEVSLIDGGLTKHEAKRSKATAFVPLISVAAVQHGYVDSTQVSKIGLLPSDGDKGKLQINDLLIVEGNGSLEHIGRTALWDGSIDNAHHQNHLIRVRPVLLEPRFALYWLGSPRGRTNLVAQATSAAGLYNLSLGKVGRVYIPIPPLDEQTEIVKQLDTARTVMESLFSLQRITVIDLDHLDQSILAKAFRGELVPQNPTDEPASVLLERRRAQRIQQARAPKQTSKSNQTSKLGKKSPKLEPQQLTLTEVLRTAD